MRARDSLGGESKRGGMSLASIHDRVIECFFTAEVLATRVLSYALATVVATGKLGLGVSLQLPQSF